jgi:hypothetical protein
MGICFAPGEGHTLLTAVDMRQGEQVLAEEVTFQRGSRRKLRKSNAVITAAVMITNHSQGHYINSFMRWSPPSCPS